MNQNSIKKHIEKKQREKYRLAVLLDDILFLPVKESTIVDVKAVISGKIAQCDISIRDHEKLLV